MLTLAKILRPETAWSGVSRSDSPSAAPTGYQLLDSQLPDGGWPAGGLAEVMCQAEGVGELQVVLPTLAALTQAGHRIAWLAPPYLPYAPALKAAGIRLGGLTVVRAPGRRDALWAAEQALRSGAFHALLLWLPRATYPELRRLAVAAQDGPGFVLAFRPLEASCEASPAVLRLALEPAAEAGGEPAVRILKRRGLPLAAPLVLPIERPVRALGRAPLSAVPPPGAVARACAA
jgi:hypothetical protein